MDFRTRFLPLICVWLIGGCNANMAMAPPNSEAGNDRVVNDEGVTLAVRVEQGDMPFPHEAIRRGIEGYVYLRFDVTELGTVENLEVVQSEPDDYFDRIAMRFIRQSRWIPAEYQGRSIRTNNMGKLLTYCVAERKPEFMVAPSVICRGGDPEALRRARLAATEREHIFD